MKEKLERSRKNKVISGVAGGIAEYFSIDPVLVRLVFVLLAFINGIGIFVYIACIIAMPQESLASALGTNVYSTGVPSDKDGQQNRSETGANENPLPPPPVPEKKDRSNVWGIILIVLGGLLLLNNVIPSFGIDDLVPLLLMAAGGWLIYRSFENSRGETA